MNIQHEIISFHPPTGSMLVRYFSEEFPEGLAYNIDVPLVDGQFVGQSEIDALIDAMKPVGQLERVALVKAAEVPEKLVPYVPVQLPATGEFVVPAAYGDEQFTPTIGQNGKDVGWFPTPPAVIEAMFELANVTSADTVYELGSGTGEMTIKAAKLGANSVGIEYNSVMVNLATRKASAEGVSDKATFVQGDILEADFSSATVVMMYLTQELNDALKAKLQAMQPGTRIVSFAFDLGDWTPSKTINAGDAVVYEWTIGA